MLDFEIDIIAILNKKFDKKVIAKNIFFMF